MNTMTAYRLLAFGKPPEFVEVDVPSPSGGEVIVKMAGAGLCHSDLHVMDAEPGYWPDPPFTLGHENAGYIAEVGPGVTLKEGTAVVVTGLDSCGVCAHCIAGRDNYCWRPASMAGRGVGFDGGLAPYLRVPARHVVDIGSLDPKVAAPFADAGATSYHAVKEMVPKLVPGSTAVVIGVGGLGGYAVQYLRHLTQAHVVAVDISQDRLDAAVELGAHSALISGESTAEELKKLVPSGADFIVDFVGSDATLSMAAQMVAVCGRLTVVGMSGGVAPVGWGHFPSGATAGLVMGYTLSDLREVAVLAASGVMAINNEYFPFEETAAAYGRLRSGEFTGRVVVTFD